MKKRTLFTLTTLLVALTLFSCSRKSDSTLASNEMLTLLPETTLAFFSWDTTSKAYDAYRKTAWHSQPDDVINELKEYTSKNSSEEAQAVVDTILALSKKGSNIEKGVVYLTASKNKLFDISGTQSINAAITVVGKASNTKSARDILSDITTEAEKNKLLVEAEKFNGNCNGVKASSQRDVKSVYLATKNDLLIAGSEKQSIDTHCTSDLNGTFIEKLKNSASFKELSAESGKKLKNKESLGIGYANFLKLYSLADNNKENTPLPFSELLTTRGIALDSKEISDVHAVSIDKNSATGKSWDAIFADSANNKVSFSIPKNPVLTSIFSGKAIQKTLQGTLEELQKQGKTTTDEETVKAMKKSLEGVESVSLLLYPAKAGSPIPQLAIKISGEKLKESYQVLLQSAKTGITMAGADSMGTWQTISVADTEVERFLTPFGLGVHLTQNQEGIFLSTHEQLLSSLLSKEDKKTQLELQRNQFQYATLDFNALSTILANVDGTVSMFTGGESLFGGSDKIKELASLGKSDMSIEYNKSALLLSLGYGKS